MTTALFYVLTLAEGVNLFDVRSPPGKKWLSFGRIVVTSATVCEMGVVALMAAVYLGNPIQASDLTLDDADPAAWVKEASIFLVTIARLLATLVFFAAYIGADRIAASDFRSQATLAAAAFKSQGQDTEAGGLKA